MAPFDLEGYLRVQQARVEELLRVRSELLAVETPPRLLEALRYSLLAGGKRLRPVLCLAFAEATAREPGLGGGGGCGVRAGVRAHVLAGA
jgi:geranylgeranyl diphosphate synthase, type II